MAGKVRHLAQQQATEVEKSVGVISVELPLLESIVKERVNWNQQALRDFTFPNASEAQTCITNANIF